jgi:hypothetical protein
MRDRVTELGGLLTVESGPGEGTRVRASFPLRALRRTGEGRTVDGRTVDDRTVDDRTGDDRTGEGAEGAGVSGEVR